MERALLLHLSAPTWASDAWLSDAWKQRYEPVLRGVLGSGAPVGLVLGGRLAELWAERHPEILHGLRHGLGDGRIEVLATALHGAVLSAIPAEDAVGQLSAHATLLKRVLGVRAQGGWLPQGVWDPTVPRLFAKAGLGWTGVDRGWLQAARAPAARALAVEREGRVVAVLPMGAPSPGWTGLGVLRIEGPAEVQRALAALPMATALPSALAGQLRTRAYLPGGGPEGLWERRLLVDEGASALHQRMLAVSRQVRRLERAVAASAHSDEGPEPQALHQARRYLYRAQAPEAYGPVEGAPRADGAWRDRAWRDLIRAEGVVDAALGAPPCGVSPHDGDGDGLGELRLRTARWAVNLAPGREGALTEVSERQAALNMTCGAVPVAFRERWGDGEPVALRWEPVTSEIPGDGSARAVLVADSALAGVAVRLTKTVLLPAQGPLGVRIEVANRGLAVARGQLSTELFAVLGGPRVDADELASVSVEVAGGKEPLDERIELPEVDCVGLVGWRGRVEIEPVPPARVCVEPLPEGGARLVLTWGIELLERDRERREVRVAVREVPRG